MDRHNRHSPAAQQQASAAAARGGQGPTGPGPSDASVLGLGVSGSAATPIDANGNKNDIVAKLQATCTTAVHEMEPLELPVFSPRGDDPSLFQMRSTSYPGQEWTPPGFGWGSSLHI